MDFLKDDYVCDSVEVNIDDSISCEVICICYVNMPKNLNSNILTGKSKMIYVSDTDTYTLRSIEDLIKGEGFRDGMMYVILENGLTAKVYRYASYGGDGEWDFSGTINGYA